MTIATRLHGIAREGFSSADPADPEAVTAWLEDAPDVASNLAQYLT